MISETMYLIRHETMKCKIQVEMLKSPIESGFFVVESYDRLLY